MSPSQEVPYGTLDLMVLKTLEALGPLHGYGIARRIEQVAEGDAGAEPGHDLSGACCGWSRRAGSGASGERARTTVAPGSTRSRAPAGSSCRGSGPVVAHRRDGESRLLEQD